MRLILINGLIGLLVAVIAQGKGHSFLRWWINGTIWGPLGLLYVIFMGKAQGKPRGGGTKKQVSCPHCHQMIAIDATECSYCKKKIDIINV